MPNRIVRDGILQSKKIASVSPLAQLFYRCLMSVVDDFGRYYADPSLLCSACYPYRPSWAAEPSVMGWIQECVTAELVTIYEVNSTEYIEIQNFGQRVRPGSVSKFPIGAAVRRETPPTAARASAPDTPPTTATSPTPAAARGLIPIRSTTPEAPPEYATRFKAAMAGRDFGNPNDDPGVEFTINRIAAECADVGADPRVGAEVVVNLMRSARCRGKPLEYLLRALRGELTPRKTVEPTGGQDARADAQ